QRREAHVVALDVDALVREPRLLAVTLAVRDLGANVGPARALRCAEHRASLAHARGRDLQIEIAGERARHETVEHGIAELTPPLRLERLLGHAGGIGCDKLRR